jgi:hypothetical protein
MQQAVTRLQRLSQGGWGVDRNGPNREVRAANAAGKIYFSGTAGESTKLNGDGRR